MLKLQLQYFGHLIRTDDSLGRSPILGKIEGRRRREHQRMRWLGSITDATDMNWSKLWEMVRDRGAECAAVQGVARSRARLGNWTTTAIPRHSSGFSVLPPSSAWREMALWATSLALVPGPSKEHLSSAQLMVLRHLRANEESFLISPWIQLVIHMDPTWTVF